MIELDATALIAGFAGKMFLNGSPFKGIAVFLRIIVLPIPKRENNEGYTEYCPSHVGTDD